MFQPVCNWTARSAFPKLPKPTLSMKFPTLLRCLALLLGLSVLGTRDAGAISLSFASAPGARISFSGATDTFEFTDSALVGPDLGRDFRITLSDGVGDAVGLRGNISGLFQIGAISTLGPLQSAPVTTVGSAASFSIFDGTTSLTADVAWIDIYTLGGAGALNSGGSLNLSNVLYSGTNADLATLAVASDRTAVITFQFIPARSLTQLTTDTFNSTSYSGSVSGDTPLRVPDGGSAVAMLGLGLIAIEAARRNLAKFRSRR
jgi:hypothetical protein